MANGLYVYAVAPRDARPPEGITGLQGGALLVVGFGELVAIASPVETAEIRPTAEQVLAHEAVVEEVRRSSPSLPVRFGTVLADATALTRALEKRHGALAADLVRIGDKVELGLSVLWDEPPTDLVAEDSHRPLPDGPGGRYLLERLVEHRRQTALERRAKEVASEVESALAPRVLDRRSDILPTARMPLRATYLVDPLAVGAFRVAFDELRRSHPALRFLLTGPWPPYSFVTPPAERDESNGDRAAGPAWSVRRQDGG